MHPFLTLPFHKFYLYLKGFVCTPFCFCLLTSFIWMWKSLLCAHFCFCLLISFIFTWKVLCASVQASASEQDSSQSGRSCVHPFLLLPLDKFYLNIRMSCVHPCMWLLLTDLQISLLYVWKVSCMKDCGGKVSFLCRKIWNFHTYKMTLSSMKLINLFMHKKILPMDDFIHRRKLGCTQFYACMEFSHMKWIEQSSHFHAWNFHALIFLCMKIFIWAHSLLFLLPPNGA